MFLSKKLNKGAGSATPPSTSDAQFNYVTMLLHGDGTNGAQNNTFLDSSSNNFTITRNGTATQGSFSPYGSNWSNYFDGSSSYLTVPYSANLSFGTGDFCVEFWLYWTGGANENNAIMNNAGGGLNIKLSATNPANWALENSYVGQVADFGTAPTKNTWHHIAVTRSSGTLYAFIDGTQVFSGSNSTNFTNPSTWYIGANGYSVSTYYIIGNLSNLRIVVGSAVYTSNFTPSTTPLTAITNTQLLTCQSNRFIDNSTNNFTITSSGTPSVQRFNPFGTATAYSTSVIGASAYIDNNGYLDCGSQSAYALGLGDFTISAWIYPTSRPTFVVILDTRGSGGSAGWALAMDSAGAVYLYSAASFSFVVTSAAGAIPLNAWSYVTVTRTTATNRLYINGVLINTGTNIDNYSFTTLTCGYSAAGGGERYYGYISDAQVIKGTAVAPTLPTAPVATSSGTSVLLNMQNGAIFDNAMMNDLVTVGNAQISTSVVKYGTGSLAFDGTGDYLVSPNMPSLQLGSGDFTIEYWIYYTSFSAYMTLLDTGGYTTSSSILFQPTITSGELVIYCGGVSITESSSPSLNTWYHYALVRSGSTATLYRNGTSVGSATSTSTITSANPFYVGGSLGGGGYYLSGYMDDVRITKGYARYTTTFTPPTAAFPNTGPV
jgi:hypothetical protein